LYYRTATWHIFWKTLKSLLQIQQENPFTINNNAVSIWRKQKDGTWKNAVDISTPEAARNK
jgi:ketosteroid isomerase-like protein